MAGDRQDFDRQAALTCPRRQTHRAQSIDFSRRQSRRRDIRRHLNQLGLEPFFAKKTAVLRDVKIDKRNAAARHGDLDLLHLRPCAVRNTEDERERNYDLLFSDRAHR